jgi:hypothetical protein
MYLAKEPLYEEINDQGLGRLAVPAGAEVREEDFERLGVAKNSSKVVKIKDDAAAIRAAHVELGLLPDLQPEALPPASED